MQPSWYNFSSWPHSDITSLGRSVTCTFLSSPFLQQRCFWDRIKTHGSKSRGQERAKREFFFWANFFLENFSDLCELTVFVCFTENHIYSGGF